MICLCPLLIARSALYVRRVVKTRCSVCPSVRPSVRSFGVRIFGDFCEADMRGGHMPLNGEVLKHRFWNFLKKSGHCVNIIDKWKIFWTIFERFFWTFFSKMFRFKIFISGRLRARAVHGVSSIKKAGHEWTRCPAFLIQSLRLVTQLFMKISNTSIR